MAIEDQMPLYDRLANLIGHIVADIVIAALLPRLNAMDQKLTELISETQRTATDVSALAKTQTQLQTDIATAITDLGEGIEAGDDAAIEAAHDALKTANDALEASTSSLSAGATSLETALGSISSVAASSPSAGSASGSSGTASGSGTTALGTDTSGAVGNQGQPVSGNAGQAATNLGDPLPGDPVGAVVPGNSASLGVDGAQKVVGSGT